MSKHKDNGYTDVFPPPIYLARQHTWPSLGTVTNANSGKLDMSSVF